MRSGFRFSATLAELTRCRSTGYGVCLCVSVCLKAACPVATTQSTGAFSPVSTRRLVPPGAWASLFSCSVRPSLHRPATSEPAARQTHPSAVLSSRTSIVQQTRTDARAIFLQSAPPARAHFFGPARLPLPR